MAERIQSIRGMEDFLPQQTQKWQYVEAVIAQNFSAYGYDEIRFPLVEKTALFKRSIGEATDVVEKEMYTFADRNGDSLSLRPEGTASCMRSVLQHSLYRQPGQRLWYYGPMFRHERPQKGRYRQFHQFGAEVFGFDTPQSDVELIALCAQLWRRLGLSQSVQLKINTLGTIAERQAYRQQLIDHWHNHYDVLDEDARNRLDVNPLRLLDSKNPAMQQAIQAAPKLIDTLTAQSRDYFDQVCQLLTELEIEYQVEPTLVRGLDYYCHTVFEWVTDQLGAQGTICAGGRYDGLAEQLGSKHALPAVGMALGMERLLLLLEAQSLTDHMASTPHAYLVLAPQAQSQGLKLAEQLRQALPQLKLIVNVNGGSFKAQFKRADRCGAQLALVLAEQELADNTVLIKFLHDQVTPQQHIERAELVTFIQNQLGGTDVCSSQ